MTTPEAQPIAGTEIPCFVFQSHQQLARQLAGTIAAVVRERQAQGQRAVLGLPTGSTPMGVYGELIRLHREDGLDLSNVVTFNLDEYYGIEPDQLQSYHRWMFEHFFNHVNIPRENIHIPDGRVPAERWPPIAGSMKRRSSRPAASIFSCWASAATGTSASTSRSRRGKPHAAGDARPADQRDAASDFFSEENVPRHAITMGVATILDARKVVLIALGEHKAGILRETAEGQASPRAGQLSAAASPTPRSGSTRPRPAS